MVGALFVRERQEVRVLFQQTSGDPGRHHGVAGGHRPYRSYQLARANILQNEATGTRPQSAKGVLVQIKRRKDEHSRAGARGSDAPGGLDAVRPRHPDVHQYHVGAESPGQFDRRISVLGLAEYLQVALGFKDHPEPASEQWLVVSQ